MARATTRKTPVKRSSPRTTKRQKAARQAEGFKAGRLFFFFCLIVVFALSIAIVGYVIFFRVVVAAEVQGDDTPIVFEEPASIQTEIDEPAQRLVKERVRRVAIIIDDMGYHPRLGRELLDLELNLTFSFLPHAPFTSEMEEEAYRRGRTVMLHLPLEPQGTEWDPGPGALYVDQSPQERRQLLEANLRQVPHATGVNNHMGSHFTEQADLMAELIDLIGEYRLFYIDSYTTPNSQGMSLAVARGVPASRRHVFLDNVQQLESICSRLEELLELAERQGDAIGIAHPHAETLEALSTCGGKILDGVALVGADELVYRVEP